MIIAVCARGTTNIDRTCAAEMDSRFMAGQEHKHTSYTVMRIRRGVLKFCAACRLWLVNGATITYLLPARGEMASDELDSCVVRICIADTPDDSLPARPRIVIVWPLLYLSRHSQPPAYVDKKPHFDSAFSPSSSRQQRLSKSLLRPPICRP
jgi:hypothetical protein